jgi:hypothetical protein
VLVGQVHGDLLGAAPGHVEAEGRHTAVHRRQAVQVDAVGHAGEEALAERALVLDDRVPPERLDVAHRRDEAGEQLARQVPSS